MIVTPSTDSILETPTEIHGVPDYELELRIREVVELITEKVKKVEKKKATKANRPKRQKKVTTLARQTMFFVGEVYKRNPDFACAIVMHYAETGCNATILIREATRLKNDPVVQGFLDYLRTALNPCGSDDAYIRGRRMVRRTAERSCMWAGLDAESTRKRVQHMRVTR